ncbi:MAG: hypothetical protein HGA85_00920 [Nanoarchaeota archaeon]|nr:hypothetical protein [Nanoarchaeota archaeon]
MRTIKEIVFGLNSYFLRHKRRTQNLLSLLLIISSFFLFAYIIPLQESRIENDEKRLGFFDSLTVQIHVINNDITNSRNMLRLFYATNNDSAYIQDIKEEIRLSKVQNLVRVKAIVKGLSEYNGSEEFIEDSISLEKAWLADYSAKSLQELDTEYNKLIAESVDLNSYINIKKMEVWKLKEEKKNATLLAVMLQIAGLLLHHFASGKDD